MSPAPLRRASGGGKASPSRLPPAGPAGDRGRNGGRGCANISPPLWGGYWRTPPSSRWRGAGGFRTFRRAGRHPTLFSPPPPPRGPSPQAPGKETKGGREIPPRPCLPPHARLGRTGAPGGTPPPSRRSARRAAGTGRSFPARRGGCPLSSPSFRPLLTKSQLFRRKKGENRTKTSREGEPGPVGAGGWRRGGAARRGAVRGSDAGSGKGCGKRADGGSPGGGGGRGKEGGR